ncbi:hypothetical protein NBC122_00396 [Chryseobacterium salivictor]|uniref:Uncharacterized protein n=1 Tax=Chryseobacterium salivictor TaxID=2547600 RepID=A0A4P6ZCV5_9FLAO|nr:hypothetical protein NBC122_00396 [Chryseobacterium salivictor]
MNFFLPRIHEFLLIFSHGFTNFFVDAHAGNVAYFLFVNSWLFILIISHEFTNFFAAVIGGLW